MTHFHDGEPSGMRDARFNEAIDLFLKVPFIEFESCDDSLTKICSMCLNFYSRFLLQELKTAELGVLTSFCIFRPVELSYFMEECH